jgi:hypothetical protein
MAAAIVAVVAASCVAASLRRLALVVAPVGLETAVLGASIASLDAVHKLAEATASEPRLSWGHGLLTTFTEAAGQRRDAEVNEQLTELTWLLDRWERVPRVCASISTSTGFMCACVALVGGVRGASADGTSWSDLEGALTAFALGLAGGVFCGAAHLRARRARSRTMGDVDRLVQRLEAVSAQAPRVS